MSKTLPKIDASARPVAGIDVIASPLLGPLLAFWGHVATGNVLILDRDNGQLVPLVPNDVQRRLWQLMVDQATAGKPIRIIIPKARKEGISTFLQALADFLCGLLPNQRAVIYAQTDADTQTIFKIALRIHYRGEPRGRRSASTAITYENNSEYVCRTFGGTGVSRGDTITFMHISELAACQSATGADAKQITGLINAVPDANHTIVVIESTGDGPVGEFYERCKKARDGIGEYELLFLPWFADAGYTRVSPLDFEPTLDEQGLMSQHGLTLGQIYWYRCKIADQSNPQLAKREFPTTFDDCFAAAAGRIYPHFNSAPLKQGGHVGRIKIGSEWERYRSIDWGAGGEHPFVCLWIAHDPDQDPGLVVSPDCEFTRDEFLAYIRDSKTGKPIKKNDHALDSLRNAIATFGLTGLVYVYREYYDKSPPSLDRIAAKIHEMSGWTMPGDAKPSEISLYERGTKGEEYQDSCADRSQPKIIEMFQGWGITPLRGHRPPSLMGKSSRGEVEDGIGLLSTHISGRTRYSPVIKEKTVEIHDKIASNSPRPTLLSFSDRKTLRRERDALARESAGEDGRLEDEPMGFGY